MASNFTQLIGLILEANPAATTPFSEANLTHADPVVLSEGTKNTSVVVSGKSSAGFSGSKTFTYNRLDIAQQLVTLGQSTPLLHVANDGVVDGVVSSAALLPAFEAVTGVQLQLEDIVVEDIVLTDAPAVVDYTLKIKTTSLKYTGQVAVQLTEDSQDISAELTNTDLNGFNYAQA